MSRKSRKNKVAAVEVTDRCRVIVGNKVVKLNPGMINNPGRDLIEAAMQYDTLRIINQEVTDNE